jgi:hemoglobin
MSETLYERLGGSEGIKSIASDIVDNHFSNPVVSKRFADSDITKVKKGAADFIITGTGGPAVYEGKDMIATHKGMNINDMEFMAVVDDIMGALNKNSVGQREQEEVLFILYSLRNDVVNQ